MLLSVDRVLGIESSAPLSGTYIPHADDGFLGFELVPVAGGERRRRSSFTLPLAQALRLTFRSKFRVIAAPVQLQNFLLEVVGMREEAPIGQLAGEELNVIVRQPEERGLAISDGGA